MLKNYSNELLNCTTINDVKELFRDAKFPNKGASNFFDKNILLVGSSNMLTNYEIKLKGVPELFLRIMLYFKLSGELGSIPQNTGEYSYMGRLHSFLKDVLNDKEVSRMDSINGEFIDIYIDNQVVKKGFSNRHIRSKILDFIGYENYEIKLPYFLRLNSSILYDSKLYKTLEEKAKQELLERNNGIGDKKTYPLYNLKILIAKSITFIESYKDECLEISKFFVATKPYDQYGKYSRTFDYLNQRKESFKESRLKLLQENIKKTKNKYRNTDGINQGREALTGKTREILREVIEQFEVSCYLITLMMTGMRVGELTTLDRRLQFEQDEHIHLKRIIYKTAETEDGEPHTMPVPNICKFALESLSELAKIKDGKKYGALILSAIEVVDMKTVRTTRINQLLIKRCKQIGLKEAVTPHQLRHAMAFLIVHIHENDGLELARMFLGHTSITMTLQYMAHYNNEIKEALEELTKEESELMVGKITEQIQNNKKLFGENGKRLMPNHKFAGQQVDEFIRLMRKGLIKLIEEEKLAIIQTPVSLCMHDLSKPEELACQRGFNIADIVANGPAPSRCKGANCSNALFFEEHVEKLKDSMYVDIEPELKKRLEQNTYFMESGGFEQDPFRRIIKEYDNYKNGVA